MRVITAPEQYENKSPHEVLCFLAGGITNCWEWQQAVIAELAEYEDNNLVIFNPRRPNFPIDDPSAADAQIIWEYFWLEHCDIFSMYFVKSKSDQPICMYELGRNLVRMEHRFPYDYKDRIVITCEPEYSRKQDVIIQSGLAMHTSIITEPPTVTAHAAMIMQCYNKIKPRWHGGKY